MRRSASPIAVLAALARDHRLTGCVEVQSRPSMRPSMAAASFQERASADIQPVARRESGRRDDKSPVGGHCAPQFCRRPELLELPA